MRQPVSRLLMEYRARIYRNLAHQFFADTQELYFQFSITDVHALDITIYADGVKTDELSVNAIGEQLSLIRQWLERIITDPLGPGGMYLRGDHP